jgi:hypothetical protein
MRKLSNAAAALLLSAVLTSAFAQTTNATLGGTVSDASGALIPGVTITATNTATGIVTTLLSNEAGAYQFASLQTGTYKVSAELSGFQTQSYNNFTLGVSQQARLNFTLQVGGVAQTVEVTVAADTLLATSSSSVGTVIPDYKLNDLPLGSRNVNALISTAAGTGPQGNDGDINGNFAGGRISAVNVTRDGFVSSNGRYTHGQFSQTYTSPDLVEEVRIVTATVDAENGRGSGQIQMVTRSGTNQFRGSAVWTNRNSKFDAANWFNNFNSVPTDFENRNQFAFRLGGPIKKNKTFFFFLLEEQRDVVRQTAVGTVLTPLARQGIFRFFPSADNQNATGTNPTVDRQGNPVRPANATGDLQQFPVFGRDPLRPSYDPSGFVQSVLLANMPLPNDYTVGDGLNTAGIRFTRRVYGQDVADGNSNDQNNRDQFNVRIDHNFNSKHKFSFVHTYERSIDHSTQAGLRSYPNGFDGQHSKWPKLSTASFVSTLSSSIVNEARGGLRRSAIASWAPFYVGRNLDGTGEPSGTGAEAFKLLPTNNGIPFQVNASFIGSNGFMNWSAGFGSTRSSRSPLWQFADTLSWTVGKHAFKMGGEHRRDQTIGWNDNNMTPQVILGASSGLGVTGINSIAGLTQNNITAAQNMLTDLAGSIGSIREGFDLADATATSFLGYKDGYVMHDRDWKSNEWSLFFKDDWKFSPRLTLNLGIHWEYFGVPYEGKGRAGKPIGGNEVGACGISCGALTASQFVGKNSPHPDVQLYKDDWNNFAPSVGLSYSLPWGGKDKTVIRAGYGWAYTGGALKSANGILDAIAGAAPGAVELSGGNGITFNPSGYTNLSNISLPIPHQYAPLSAVPINGQRSDTLAVYSTNRTTPYLQNFNLEIQRAITDTFTLDVAYVGSKGTKLFGGRNLNVVDINSRAADQTLLEAFNITRAGGNAAYFDRLLNGITIGGGVNTPVNGTSLTGSMALRQNSTTRPFIANGNVGALANYLNTNTAGTGQGGGLYTTNGLPQNFFVLNPQFATVNYFDNSVGSTYHSLQIQTTQRLTRGFSNQFTYTWSKALDISDGDGIISPRDPNNIKLDKARAGFDRTHIFSTTGTYELPFGQGRSFLSNAPSWVQRLTERWSLGGIFAYSTGQPMTIVAPVSTVWQTTTNSTPLALAPLPTKGKITYVSNGVSFFPGLTQIQDPSVSGVTTTNNTRQSFNNYAIADANGNPILANPAPGQVGTLGRNTIVGPASVDLDMNLLKRLRLSETKQLELGVNAVNVLNHPNFGNPNININSTGSGTTTGTTGTNTPFGRITTATGARRFTMSARLNF